MSSINLAVFVSGHGSNLEVFLQNKQQFQSLWVVSSNAEAHGLTRASNHGVESHVLPKNIDWQALHEALESRNIDKIFLAGFMKIVPASFVEKWHGRLFNLHPSLLPNYKGLRAIERAHADGEAVGVTIHHVVAAVDAGDIVLQDCAVSKEAVVNMDLEAVIERTHAKEHELVQAWIDQLH